MFYFSPKLNAWYIDAIQECGEEIYRKWVDSGQKIDYGYAKKLLAELGSIGYQGY